MASKSNQQSAPRKPDTGNPQDGSGEGRRDVTGVMPDNIRIDPDITEGHPGYNESGDSEIIPPPTEGKKE